MPLYEFSCQECRRSFEGFFSLREDTERAFCPYCGSQKVEKVLSHFSTRKESSIRRECRGRGFS